MCRSEDTVLTLSTVPKTMYVSIYLLALAFTVTSKSEGFLHDEWHISAQWNAAKLIIKENRNYKLGVNIEWAAYLPIK